MTFLNIAHMLRVSFVYCLLVFLGSMANASEPRIQSVKEALGGGQVAFIGRIISTHEIERKADRITGEADIEVRHCYYGIDFKTAKTVKLCYVINTSVYHAFPVQFNISDDVLFVLSRELVSNRYFFSSDFEIGLDFAYIIGDTFPENYYRGSKMRFINIYRNQLIYSEEKNDINKWASERAAELNRNNF